MIPQRTAKRIYDGDPIEIGGEWDGATTVHYPKRTKRERQRTRKQALSSVNHLGKQLQQGAVKTRKGDE